MKKFGEIMAKIGIVLLVTIVMLFGAFYFMLVQFKTGPSESAKNLFITTILETGQMKFLASWVCSEEEIQAIVDANKMKDLNDEVDASLINFGTTTAPENTTVAPTTEKAQETSSQAQQPQESSGVIETTTETVAPTTTETVPETTVAPEQFDENGVRIEKISGRTFSATMMIVKDPSKVKVATIYPWAEEGKTLDVIVSEAGAIGGVNGGLYHSSGNSGGRPIGVVVQDGQITYNSPYNIAGLYLIGMNTNNVLIIKNIEGYNEGQVKQLVADYGIRDAVSFQDEASDANNHFVPLIINGTARELQGQGSGANPRTVIGQRADGAILLLVTDGRGVEGHLGATASDLIDVMLEYGAVNAANIDGGSSSSMVYKNEFLMSSVTFYYRQSSWKLPTSFVVMP